MTIHVTSTYNVEASINKAYYDAIAAVSGLPAFMTVPAVVFNWPEIEASTPCFSVVHFTGSSSDRYQGRVDTNTASVMYNTGILEVSAWVSRDQKVNGQDVWAARLSYMKGMLQQVHTKLPVILIKDFESNPSTPSATGFKVNMGDMNEVQVGMDENPSIRRKRFLINYNWHLRAT